MGPLKNVMKWSLKWPRSQVKRYCTKKIKSSRDAHLCHINGPTNLLTRGGKIKAVITHDKNSR